MPDLDKLPVPQYAAEQPYHYDYDNLPLKTLAERDVLISNAVDKIDGILADAAGSTASLADRLDESLNADGTISVSTIDDTNHNIAKHEDAYNSTAVGAGTTTVDAGELLAYQGLGFPSLTSPVSFVRMLDVERNKLANVQTGATNLTISFPDATVAIFGDTNPTLTISDSPTVAWAWDGSSISAGVVGSFTNPHQHYYNSIPYNPSVDYQNYQTTISSTPFMSGSLRVYVNGVRLPEYDALNTVYAYVPSSTFSGGQPASWSQNYFDPDPTGGTFALYAAIDSGDTITIDFDIDLS